MTFTVPNPDGTTDVVLSCTLYRTATGPTVVANG
ncbi:hypothetical protein Xcel_2056 [Xylanimonas cellulosilytica DSM 15894]|uniref:Uncharacterized protein n=1 Tax=Xylanimonas cellulosilytica (strain DSM 15894 / JCM 12276 / CECT 5975 / KCTC 9989 / LMG 20990 / NBRC 107835 / XIL07) TaxID=446471 RepID=D1BU61_XYLCX|nr:hypothetical protein Xcel_2056 [Xylanimonas cellulosilytica DSM 15894]